jgi:class I fructose-bisphosphate aldolase/fructose-bisphosphate aldolase/2-amino-3,7-dideoxy-D-threo-hept-6-ulosonate synthase
MSEAAAKRVRMGRFVRRASRRGLIVPLDHGLTLGPIAGLESVARIGRWIVSPDIDGVIVHKGLAERLAQRGFLDGLGLMIHLNGMPALAGTPDTKELVTSVRTAVRLGADAVSVQLNFDGTNDTHNLRLLGGVVDEALEYGLPVLTMLYDKKASVVPEGRLRRLRHLMRLTIELGTDALKIAAPERLADVPAILDSLRDDCPIFFAGGSLGSDAALLELAREATRFGGAGLCVGRNVFQREEPQPMLHQLAAILHEAPRHVTPALVRDGGYAGVH